MTILPPDLDPELFERLVTTGGGALTRRMGIEFLELTAERSVATMPVEGNTQVIGLLHGGAHVVLTDYPRDPDFGWQLYCDHPSGGRALLDAARISPDLAPWAAAYRADVALVNYYPPGSSMGLHVDAMEESPAPVVSLSIGDEALFRMGGTEGRSKPWDDVLLMSGDLLVFGGPARRAYHGVPRIRPGTPPAGCGVAEGRLNITIRQVDH